MKQQDIPPIAGRRVLREPVVEGVTGLSASTIDREVAAGRFPAPIRLTPRAKGWLESEIDAWLEARVADRDKAA